MLLGNIHVVIDILGIDESLNFMPYYIVRHIQELVKGVN